MLFHGRQLESLTGADLEALICDSVVEHRSIEYKAALPGTSDEARREFLADICSLANALGGDVIYGMKEEGGAPTVLCGLSGINQDAETLRLESMIRDGIQPRIPGVEVRAVPLTEGRSAVVLRIPRSWARPHMVTYKGSSRFYARNSAGKHRLDVHEIRDAFRLSEDVSEGLKRFRVDRVNCVLSGETPVPLQHGPKVILHVLPLEALTSAPRLEVSNLSYRADVPLPLAASDWRGRHNLDGFVTWAPPDIERPPATYVLTFRSGALEAVDLRILRDGREVRSVLLERKILERVPGYVQFLRSEGIAEPVLLAVTLTGVAGFRLRVSGEFADEGDVFPIDRDLLFLPEVLVDNKLVDAASALKPVFDALWQAAGYPRCFDYDAQGQWRPGE